MAEELRLNIVSTADSKGLTKAAHDMAEAKDEANKLGQSFEDMGDNAEKSEQKVSAATKGVRDHKEQIKLLRAEYEKTTRTIADLDAQLLGGEGDSKQVRKDLREQRALLAELQRVAREVKRTSGINFSLSGDGGGGAASALGGLGKIGGLPTPAVAGLVGAGSVAGIPLAAMIGGAISGATGTAAMAVGILSAAKDPKVQAAAKSFGQIVSAEFFHGGEAFVQPVIDGLAILKDAFHDIDLGESLEKVAPTVTVIAEGIADFARNFKPGFDKALERMGPFAEAAAEGIGDLGDALGDTLDMITDSEGAVDGIRLTFAALGGTLRFIGAELKFLEDRWHEIINAIGMFSSIGANTGFATFDQGIRQLTGHSGELEGAITFMGNSAGEAARKNYDLANGLGAVKTNAFNAIDALKQYDDQLAGRANGQIAFEQSLDDLAAGFKQFGRNLNIDTQNGRENMKNLEGAITDAQKVRDDLLAQGKIEEANAAYKRMTDRIREVMKAAGFTKQAIDAMVGPRELVIGITYKERNRPTFIASNYSQPAQDAMGAGRRASGGPVTAGMPYVVGDGGRPEWFVPEQSGYVYPKVPSTGGGMMDARPVNITVVGSADDAAMIERLRVAIASRGGTLAVLGLRA